jgi:hypothetical protein
MKSGGTRSVGRALVGLVGWVRGGGRGGLTDAALDRGAPGVGRSVGPWVQVMDPLIYHPR